ncbi:MAG: NADPH-dependent FMN reductase [Fermentimonas sp.]|jgi:chromate reductase
MNKKKIAIIVGSLRKDSFNRKLALHAIKNQPESLDMEIVEIGQLPHYNEDYDVANEPAEYAEFRKKIGEADGFLFFTPEYNRTIPGVLKNAIDVASRPYGHNKWNGKPGAIISSSTGPTGGMAANHALRQPMVFVNVLMMQQPECYIANSYTLFDEDGNLTDKSTAEYLDKVLKSYEEWVNKF